MFLVMDFFRFILSGVCSSSSWICDVYVSYQNWEVFSHYSSSIFFSLLFIHSFQDPSEMSGRTLCSPAGPWGFLIFFFQSIFSLLLLNRFSCSIFWFHSFFRQPLPFCCWVLLLSLLWLLYFTKFLFSSSLHFQFIAEMNSLFICFKCICNCSLKHFYGCCFNVFCR